MMEAIRNLSGNIIFKGLFGLLILGFIFWGASDVMTGNMSRTSAIEVGEIEISPREVQREFEDNFERINRTLGGQLTREQARGFGLINQSVNALISRAVSRLAAHDLGIVISDSLVIETIQSDKTFQNALGKFDRQVYEMTLAQSGLTEANYVALIKRDLATNLMVRPMFDGAKPADLLVNTLYGIRGEKRAVDYVVIERKGLANIPIPREEELEKYYKDHPKAFTAPEYRKVSYISLTADELAPGIEVSDEALQAAYDERQGEFNKPEKRKIKQIMLTDEARAKKAYDQLKSGQDFNTVAKEIAGMDAAATDLGELARADVFLPELGDAAFALTDGAYSEPVKSSLGWHILKVDGITPAQASKFEEVKDKLKKDVAHEKAIDALFELANKLEDKLSGGATLEEAANEVGGKIKVIAKIDSNGLDDKEKPVADLPSAQFKNVAFSTPEGEQSQLTEAGEDGYFLLRVDSVIAPALKPFQDIMADVIVAWKKETEDKAMEKAAADLVTQTKKQADLGKAALETGINTKVFKAEAFTRDGIGGPKAFPAEFINAIFAAQKGESVSGIIDDASFVAKVTDIIPADQAKDTDKMEAIRKEVSGSMQGDLDQQLALALRKTYPPKINKRAIDELFQ